MGDVSRVHVEYAGRPFSASSTVETQASAGVTHANLPIPLLTLDRLLRESSGYTHPSER